jgi:hypothetical protein
VEDVLYTTQQHQHRQRLPQLSHNFIQFLGKNIFILFKLKKHNYFMNYELFTIIFLNYYLKKIFSKIKIKKIYF